MSSLNKIILIGEIATDIEIRATQNGNQVAKFDIVVRRPETLQENIQNTKTDTFTVVCWDDLATTVSKLQKGALTVVEGRISNRSFETDMGRKYVTEIDARKVVGLSNLNTPSNSSDNFDSFTPTSPNLEQNENLDSVDFNFDQAPPDLAKALEDSQQASNQDIPF